MAKVLFVDDRLNEVARQWQLSGCGEYHQLLPLEPFESIERTGQMVRDLQPDVIIIGFGLSRPDVNGADVIRSLRNQGFAGYFVANSGGGVAQFAEVDIELNATADRKPERLRNILAEFKQN